MTDGGEPLLLLSEAALDALETVRACRPSSGIPAAVTDPVRRLIAAALEASATLTEVGPDFSITGVALTGAPVVAVPGPQRSWYPWVAIDLGKEAGARRDTFVEGIMRANPARGGLVLTWQDVKSLPAHAEVISAGSSGCTTLFLFVQLVRAVLRTLPPARVVIADLAEAVLLADALHLHAVAIGVCALSARSRRQRRQDTIDGYLQRLVCLSKLGDAADALTAIAASGEGRGIAWDLVRRANALLLPRQDTTLYRELLGVARGGALLSWSGAAIASHLSNGEGVQKATSLHASDALRIREVDLTKRAPDPGGRRVLFSCLHLLGDALNATPVLRAHRRLHPEDHLTFLLPDEPFARIFEFSPDVDQLAFIDTAGQHDLVFQPSRSLVEGLSYTTTKFDRHHVLDIQEVSSDPVRRAQHLHMAEGYAHMIGVQIDSRQPSLDVGRARAHQPMAAPAGQYVVIARHTVSGRYHNPSSKHTKRWEEAKWRRLAGKLRRELRVQPVSIGTITEQRLECPGVLDLHDLSILEVAGLLTGAAALICVDNGVFHLALALGTPVVHLSPAWLEANWTSSCDEVPHRDVRGFLPRMTVESVFRALVELLEEVAGHRVRSPSQ
jgi:ADP-heptose:LPS heptosyltransferase